MKTRLKHKRNSIMHAYKFIWNKIIIVNSQLLRTNGVRETLDCVKDKRIDSSAEYILMPSAIPFPGLLDYLIHTINAGETGFVYFC